MEASAKILILAGVVLIITGLLLAGRLGPLGHLPGDIHVTRNNFTLFIPITTTLLISCVASVILWLLHRF